jgi:MFS family permease
MPEGLRHNYIHLLLDIGWYAVLNATTLAFLTIYATRIHATSQQIGFLNAVPALMTMLLSLPAVAYVEKRSLNKSALILGTVHRSFYFMLVILPWIASAPRQIDLLMLGTLVMYIPYSAFSLTFNALFGAAVPPEWRGYFAGSRNAVLAVVTILVSLLSGYLLEVLPFPVGYQVVFGMGFVGGMMSLYHVVRIRIDPVEVVSESAVKDRDEKPPLFKRILQSLRTDVLKGQFLRVLLALTLFHFTLYLPIPIFPQYYVNHLNLSDQVISIGTALYYLAMFLGSLQHSRIVNRFGNKWAVGAGMLLLALYPGILSLATGPALYLIASIVSGTAWSLCGTAFFNYLLESVPTGNRAAHLAWYSLLCNFGVLAGSLFGPVVGNWAGILPALVIFAILRAATGAAILRWG